MNQIPNAITCLNVLSGTLAILMATKGDASVGALTGMEWAWIFVGIAAVADFFDGFAARMLHAYSSLGKELDSLCDLVSFGVAPAVIMVSTLGNTPDAGWQAWLPVLIPVAAALRLAKFNIDTRQATSFLGLPVPANAIFWIGYSQLAATSLPMLSSWYMVAVAVAVLCWLMVSEVPLFSLKISTLKAAAVWRQCVLVLAAIGFVIALGVGGLMWLILFYIVLSIATGRR